MHFTPPAFVEIKMDAEIGSYQEDGDPRRDPYFASTAQLQGGVGEAMLNGDDDRSTRR